MGRPPPPASRRSYERRRAGRRRRSPRRLEQPVLSFGTTTRGPEAGWPRQTLKVQVQRRPAPVLSVVAARPVRLLPKDRAAPRPTPPLEVWHPSVALNRAPLALAPPALDRSAGRSPGCRSPR